MSVLLKKVELIPGTGCNTTGGKGDGARGGPPGPGDPGVGCINTGVKGMGGTFGGSGAGAGV